MEVKAAALHALALVLGPPSNASPTGADEVMGNTAAEEERETRSLLCRTLFERLGLCNRRSAGALVVELARQPVPEVKCLLFLLGSSGSDQNHARYGIIIFKPSINSGSARHHDCCHAA